MFTVRSEYGKRVVYCFGFRLFVISAAGISLAPSVHKTVEWSEIRNRPASEIILVQESATGAINGVNVEFTSSQPFACVYVNGLLQIEGAHYTKIDEVTFQMGDAPLPGDSVTVSFII